MIEDTVRYLKEMGKEVVYDAEHFFDGLRTILSMLFPPWRVHSWRGQTFLTLCETNGGKLVTPFQKITQAVVDHFPIPKSGYIATMMPVLVLQSV